MISLDWTLGLQFVNFFILLIILNKLVYRPLLRVMAERRQTIEGGHQKAKNLEVQIAEKMEHYQQQLSEAKLVANQERNQLKKAAAAEESVLLSEAQGKAGSRLQAIKAQVAAEAADASKTLQKEAGSLAGQIASKILGRNVA